jgi:N-acetylglucosaminyldiphosphoundecaprenol N-acetyl-beta-D-mannosaminyltransferase
MTEPASEAKLLGTRLTLLGQEELLASIAWWVESNEKSLVLSGNAHSYNLAYKNVWLREMFERAGAIRIDGVGVCVGARLLGIRTPKRRTWADFALDLAGLCERLGFTLFFLGSRPNIAQRAAANLEGRFPNLRVVGIHHGYFDKTPGSPENEVVIQKINAVRPNILIVAFGMPLQERWLMENWARIEANVALTGGAVFDYVSGELRRAPRWMTDHGLEWLGRLLIEPRRLWKRYLVGVPLFLWRVLKQRLGLLRFE